MHRAIKIARNGLGTTAPNPAVGAVIVHDGKIIGEGYTSAFGGPHAEVNALASVADGTLPNKDLLKQACLYVTLEPCSHFGKTPPCTDLIIEKGIKTVVIGLKDPFEKVAGRGIEKLKEAGIEVVTGVLEKECREHHKRFLTFHEKKRPYIILKWAQTLDGFIAPPTHGREKKLAPVWISHPYSRQLAHQWRSEEQAILVGTNTVLDDNPRLDVRHWTGKNPMRIILDRSLKTHVSVETKVNSGIESEDDYHILDGSIPTLILTKTGNQSLYCNYVDYEVMDFSKNIARNISDILYKYNVQSVIIEGGAMTLQSFIDDNLWDEARLFEGKNCFTEGIRAPVLSGTLIASRTIASDTLRLFRNSSETQ